MLKSTKHKFHIFRNFQKKYRRQNFNLEMNINSKYRIFNILCECNKFHIGENSTPLEIHINELKDYTRKKNFIKLKFSNISGTMFTISRHYFTQKEEIVQKGCLKFGGEPNSIASISAEICRS